MKRLVIILFCVLIGSDASAQEPTGRLNVQVDFGKPVGILKALHGVNGGPAVVAAHSADLKKRHLDAGFPSVRLHDCHWPHPDVVDVPAIFPLFHLDPDDPNHYLFEKTDAYLKPIVDNGASIVFRLGVSIEHLPPRFHTDPPTDFEKWTKVCVNILRHYNDGWADGYHYNIRHVEIWNEPNIGPRMWAGIDQQYFELYQTAVTAIKQYNPDIMVGGPVTSIPDAPMVQPFLSYCRDHQLPLDFFSWHSYSDNLPKLIERSEIARSLLDKNGFEKTESWLTEWRPMIADFGKVRWQQKSPRHTVGAAFARNRNHEAAAFTASALLQMQDAPIDMAHFYNADDSPWSMFDEYGEPGHTYFAMLAFQQFLRAPKRVAVTGASGKDEISVGAGLSQDGKLAMIIASNFRSETNSVRLELHNFLWKTKVNVSGWRIDEKNEFLAETDFEIDPENPVLELSLPAGSVVLLQLQPDGRSGIIPAHNLQTP